MTEHTPKCQYFNSCGGCSLQHIPYVLTLENKKNFVLDQLKKLGIQTPEHVEIQHTDEYNYRNRMDFVYFEKGLGLRKKESFDKIIKIDRCEIANEKINALLKEVNEFSMKMNLEPFNLRNKRGTMKYALIRTAEYTDDSCVSFALNTDSGNLANHIDILKEFAKKTSAKNVMIARVPAQKDDSCSSENFAIKGSEFIQENFLGKKIVYHSQGFFQNNPKTAVLMIQKTKEIFSKYNTNNSKLLDLYGGVGTFGICLADMFKKTTIVEFVKDSIDCAKINIKENNIQNTEAFVLDSAKMNKVVQKEIINKETGENQLFVVNDPPRSGMTRQAIDNLMALDAQVIVYISCNPLQFAREMLLFQKKYEIKSLTVFDMFPQTNHIESMAELVLKKEL